MDEVVGAVIMRGWGSILTIEKLLVVATCLLIEIMAINSRIDKSRNKESFDLFIVI
jgi:hypothetical protein